MAIGATGSAVGSGDTSRRSLTSDFLLGTSVVLTDGYAWVYVQAMGSIPANQTDVNVTAAFSASDSGGSYVNTAAFEDEEYGWVRSPEKLA